MEYLILENYIETPIKIYEGSEPKRIIYKIKNKKGRVECEIDLWSVYENNKYKIIEKEKKEEINKILKIPIKKSITINEEEIMTDKIDEEDTLLEFVGCGKYFEYIVVYTLYEDQPMVYKCYIIAVLKEEKSIANKSKPE